MFTANRGQTLLDISKVASGGELSRLMLAVKSEMAKTAQLPSMYLMKLIQEFLEMLQIVLDTRSKT